MSETTQNQPGDLGDNKPTPEQEPNKSESTLKPIGVSNDEQNSPKGKNNLEEEDNGVSPGGQQKNGTRNENSMFESDDGGSERKGASNNDKNRNAPENTEKNDGLSGSQDKNSTALQEKEKAKQETADAKAKAEELSKKQEEELTSMLLDATLKKHCEEHKQAIITICTDFQCPKRFWCGICCVKSKDLYVKHSSSMTLISDFLEENISLLYKVKTYSQNDKTTVEEKLEEIVTKNERNLEKVWQSIEVDIGLLKKEILTRIDKSTENLKQKHERFVDSMKEFYTEIKDKVRESTTRDCSQELEVLKNRVQSGEEDALTVIESIGNKVNVDAKEIEAMNVEFNKTKKFVDFIYNNYDSVKEQTLLNYNSMEKSIDGLVDKVGSQTSVKIKSTLEEPQKELQSLLDYYDRLLRARGSTGDIDMLMMSYLVSQETRDHPSRDFQEEYERRPHNYPKDNSEDRRIPGMNPEKNNDYRASEAPIKGSYTGSRANLPNNRDNLTPSPMNRPTLYKSFEPTQSLVPQNDMVVDLTDRSSSPSQYLYDGCLTPLFNDADIESLEKTSSLALSNDPKDFVPIIYLHNDTLLFTTFHKKIDSTSSVYGFKIHMVPEDPADDPRLGVGYGSDGFFTIPAKINHLCVVERESDKVSLLCVNSEDGYIRLFSFNFFEDGEWDVGLLNTIHPRVYEGQITSMKRLSYSDFLVCTNTRGEILVFDTIKCEITSSEKGNLS